QQGVSIIASGGKECPLTFLKGEKKKCTEGIISPTDARTVVNGMIQACDTGGTGWPFFDFKINGKRVKVACKTGTAESVSKKTNPHAWFTVFAPANKPRIAMTVLVENGGEGSSIAAPIAKKILEEFLSVY
ncbi:MAG: penicillin-binding transpeptidase domain-containing protein, partial [Patescibacteria group bacterium]